MELDKFDIKVHMENKHARMTRKTLKNLKTFKRRLALAYIKTYYKTLVIKAVWYWCMKRQ